MLKDPNQTIGVPSRGGGEIRVNGLTEKETDILSASLKGGHHWVRRGIDGRLESLPSWDPLPEPAADEAMLPFWQPAGEGCEVQMEMFYPKDGFDIKKYRQDCSFTIHALCAYQYSTANYRNQAEFLTECGFMCLRTPRDLVSGQYHELWHLPGLWRASGPLKEAVDKTGCSHPRLRAKHAVTFLAQNAQFGSMDVSVQRLATVLS